MTNQELADLVLQEFCDFLRGVEVMDPGAQIIKRRTTLGGDKTGNWFVTFRPSS
jgi:hypothetical protein